MFHLMFKSILKVYIASLFSSGTSFSSDSLLITSSVATDTSYATLFSTVPSSCFFSYCLDCTLPTTLISVPTATVSQNFAFLPHAIQGI